MLSVINTIRNFRFVNKGKQLRFDVYTRSTGKEFHMGNSSYYFTTTPGMFDNVKLLKQNIKYNSGKYQLMTAGIHPNTKIFWVQLRQEGGTEIVSSAKYYGERICTIQLDRIAEGSFTIIWRTLDSAVVKAELLENVDNEFEGHYE